MVSTDLLTFVKLPAVVEEVFVSMDHLVFAAQEDHEAALLFTAAPDLLVTLALLYENADLSEEQVFMVKMALQQAGALC